MALLLPTRKELVLLPEWYETNPDIESNLDAILTTSKTRGNRIPFGYKDYSTPEQKDYRPVEELICGLIQLLAETRYEGKRSLRDSLERCQKMAESVEGYEEYVTSLGGLSNIFTRLEKDLGISQKETTKERLSRIVKERRQKAIAENRSRPYHYAKPTQQKVDKQKELTRVNSEIKKLKEKERRLKIKAAKKARDLKLKKDPTRYKTSDTDNSTLEYVEPEVKSSKKVEAPAISVENLVDKYTKGLALGLNESTLMDMYKEIMENKDKFDKKRIVFLPTPRQYLFLSAPEDIVLYGGAAG